MVSKEMKSFIDSIDWDKTYLKLYAWTHNYARSLASQNGKPMKQILGDKEVGDYVQEGIKKFILEPYKFDPSKKRKLENYISLHLIRGLFSNDGRSAHRQRVVPISSTVERKAGNISGAELLDEKIDREIVLDQIAFDIKGDELLEKIFEGICVRGMKRSEICQAFNISESDYDNGMKRLSTAILKVKENMGL